MNDMQLSGHFRLREFLSSETAARMGREIEPPPDVLTNLQRLCQQVLEPIRVMLDKPVVITSGYRPGWLNAAIGGSQTSAHMTGNAADIKVVGMTPLVFCRWVEEHAKQHSWPIDQCIQEFGHWTHIGTAMAPRYQFLTAKNLTGRTIYLNGIQP
jgi:zinc D-Ala-D-Ala carboxypeptidase